MGMKKFLEKPGSVKGKAESVAHKMKYKKSADEVQPHKRVGKKRSRKRA